MQSPFFREVCHYYTCTVVFRSMGERITQFFQKTCTFSMHVNPALPNCLGSDCVIKVWPRDASLVQLWSTCLSKLSLWTRKLLQPLSHKAPVCHDPAQDCTRITRSCNNLHISINNKQTRLLVLPVCAL